MPIPSSHARLARVAVPVALGSMALLGLSACSSASAPAASAPTSASGGASASGAAGSSSAAGALKDGSYSALGMYQSPGGASAVDVALTLSGGVVKTLTVTPKAENPTAQQYESRFASGVGALAVGKRITDLNVTKVSGSSLTSQGFDKAIAAIEAQAK